MSISASQALPIRGKPPSAADGWMLCIVGALLGFGVVMVYSASVAVGGGLESLVRHVLSIAVGILAATIASVFPLEWWQRLSKPLLLAGLIGLVVVLVPSIGIEVNGSRRWLPLGPVQIQPSELVKVLLVVYVASYLTRKHDQLQVFRDGILMVGIVVAGTAAMLLAEPDFGTAVVITVTVGIMLFLGGVRFSHFLLCVVVGVAAMSVLTVISPYRLERVTGFLEPWSDPFGTGFQLVQALIAFGRGDWLGVGLGASIQKLYYLPHASNDFLLAVIGEELGLAGVGAVIALFAALTWRAFFVARLAVAAGNLFGARVAQGIGVLFAVQAMINMGVNLGVLPTKGLTLPLMSYGGSSMVASAVAVGLLLGVYRRALPMPRGAR